MTLYSILLILVCLVSFLALVKLISALSDNYLLRIFLTLASLENMGKKFNLPKNGDCIILAIGCSIPEMITNVMSVFDENSENFSYGFGVIIGSGVFGNFT
jgi:Ca2+/Na+ antiporter